MCFVQTVVLTQVQSLVFLLRLVPRCTTNCRPESKAFILHTESSSVERYDRQGFRIFTCEGAPLFCIFIVSLESAVAEQTDVSVHVS